MKIKGSFISHSVKALGQLSITQLRLTMDIKGAMLFPRTRRTLEKGVPWEGASSVTVPPLPQVQPLEEGLSWGPEGPWTRTTYTMALNVRGPMPQLTPTKNIITEGKSQEQSSRWQVNQCIFIRHGDFFLHSDLLTRASFSQNLFDHWGEQASSMLPLHSTPGCSLGNLAFNQAFLVDPGPLLPY